jgi:pyruvate formate lyase activating enzyme
MDAANIDLKAFTPEFYRRLCKGDLQTVLETLVYLKQHTEVWFEITTLLIPGMNDSDEEVGRECRWIREELGTDVPLHFSAFHPDFMMRDIPPTPPSTLTRAREIALGEGLHYVYTGNVHDEAGSSTYCRQCGERLIGRDWYQLTDWRLDEGGRCRACGAECAGHFGAGPGTWGARRMAVDVHSFAARVS